MSRRAGLLCRGYPRHVRRAGPELRGRVETAARRAQKAVDAHSGQGRKIVEQGLGPRGGDGDKQVIAAGLSQHPMGGLAGRVDAETAQVGMRNKPAGKRTEIDDLP